MKHRNNNDDNDNNHKMNNEWSSKVSRKNVVRVEWYAISPKWNELA